LNTQTFIRRVDKVLGQEPELAMQYTQVTNENIDDLVPDMYQLIQKNQIADSDVDMVLRNSIKLAISTETSVLDILSMKDRIPTDITGSIGRYFEEVGKVYERNNNDMDIEYCPANRTKLIEMNTKTVIYIAKQYRNKGVEFDDLIGAGNLGLCIAFDKFKPNEFKLNTKLQDSIDEFDCDENEKVIDGIDAVAAMSRVITYGKLNTKLVKSFKVGVKYSKADMRNWVEKNICAARFNSVASMWIRACILQEIKNSKLVHRPDSVRAKSKQETGVYNPDVYVSIDKPVSGDTDTTLENFLDSSDDTEDAIDKQDTMEMVRDLLGKLLKGVSVRDRRIFLKKFGIGLPRPMQPKEIAEQEDLSIARVSQIFQQVLTTIKENSETLDISEDYIRNILDRLSES
jgi:DNA-directed RNA polymerase sigma subunit (sigma70/sigma32)